MQTDWKIDMTMVDSMGDPLHNIMHSMGTSSVMGWNTVCYTGYRIVHIECDDITYTLKIKPLEKQGHATSKM